jgi:hypothetical protein
MICAGGQSCSVQLRLDARTLDLISLVDCGCDACVFVEDGTQHGPVLLDGAACCTRLATQRFKHKTVGNGEGVVRACDKPDRMSSCVRSRVCVISLASSRASRPCWLVLLWPVRVETAARHRILRARFEHEPPTSSTAASLACTCASHDRRALTALDRSRNRRSSPSIRRWSARSWPYSKLPDVHRHMPQRLRSVDTPTTPFFA